MSEDRSKPWRNERKFRITPVQQAAAAGWCRRAMAPDPHAGPGGDYFIRSVYWDSLAEGDYADKVFGALFRKKIRLRVYSESPAFALLERKRKIGMWNQKERVKLVIGEAEALLAGDWDVLFRKGTETALRFYAEMKAQLYRPVVNVEYEREAYVLPFEDIRVTFDKSVRYSVSDLGLSGRKSMVPLFPGGDVILEVKYNEEFPRWMAARLGAVDEVQVALSKFGLALAPWRSEA
ncbi:MAG: polyphosphate polymerase domain-containing protein [Opitutae bacterium]|nr:polyphosphate polymerase domain-containing protein [Opitutae bacterium]